MIRKTMTRIRSLLPSSITASHASFNSFTSIAHFLRSLRLLFPSAHKRIDQAFVDTPSSTLKTNILCFSQSTHKHIHLRFIPRGQRVDDKNATSGEVVVRQAPRGPHPPEAFAFAPSAPDQTARASRNFHAHLGTSGSSKKKPHRSSCSRRREP